MTSSDSINVSGTTDSCFRGVSNYSTHGPIMNYAPKMSTLNAKSVGSPRCKSVSGSMGLNTQLDNNFGISIATILAIIVVKLTE